MAEALDKPGLFDSQPARASLQYSMLLQYLNEHREHISPELRGFILHARDEGVSGPPLLALANAMVEQGFSMRDTPSYWMAALRNIIFRSEHDAIHFRSLEEHLGL